MKTQNLLNQRDTGNSLEKIQIRYYNAAKRYDKLNSSLLERLVSDQQPIMTCIPAAKKPPTVMHTSSVRC